MGKTRKRFVSIVLKVAVQKTLAFFRRFLFVDWVLEAFLLKFHKTSAKNYKTGM